MRKRGDQGKEARIVTSTRISRAGYEYLKNRADREKVRPAELHRRMLAYAAKHMPMGWEPDGQAEHE